MSELAERIAGQKKTYMDHKGQMRDRDTGKLIKERKNPENLFTVLPANEWILKAKLRPIPKKLFFEFWYEGEVCILFADTNVGKSILAVQIGEYISKGVATKRQKVLYYDFELSDKQFEARYSDNFTNHHEFDEYFLRAEINPDNHDSYEAFDTFEDYITYSIEKSIEETGSKVIIIDNITYLRSETEKAKDALPLMKSLKALKNKHGLSILVLAHTPKRDNTKPLGKNDLQGSKMLINFCDSAFAIGESTRDKSTRYLKQIKVRQDEYKYDAENVWVHSIEKRINWLCFNPMEYSSERDHLKIISDQEMKELDDQIFELSKTITNQREIARQLGTNPMRVNRVFKRRNVTGVTGVTP